MQVEVPLRTALLPVHPLMTTLMAGQVPITGLKVKLVVLVPTPVPTVTVIGPVIALTGTGTVILVAVAAVGTASIPPNFTILLASVVLKFAPVMVITVPIPPIAGRKLVMVGCGIGSSFLHVVRSIEIAIALIANLNIFFI